MSSNVSSMLRSHNSRHSSVTSPRGGASPKTHTGHAIHALVLANNLVINMLIGQMSTFFPLYSKQHLGTSTLTIGLIYATCPLTNMCISPIIAYLSSPGTRIFYLYLGFALQLLGTVLFGFWRTVPGFLCARVMQGTGFASSGVILLSLLVDTTEPEFELPKLMGHLELVVGLGYMIGPPLGGLLYSFFGFERTFLCFSTLPVILLLHVTYLIYKDSRLFTREYSTSSPASSFSSDMISVFSGPVILGAVILIYVFLVMGLLEIELGIHVTDWLGVSTGIVGLLYAMHSLVYAIFSVIAGKLSQHKLKRTIVIGLVILVIGLLLLGPMPLIQLNTIDTPFLDWFLVCSGLILLAVGIALALIPVLPLMNLSTNSDLDAGYISSVYLASCSLGEVIGPVLGGWMIHILPHVEEMGSATTQTGFPWTALALAGAGIALMILTLWKMPTKKEMQEEYCQPLVSPGDHEE